MPGLIRKFSFYLLILFIDFGCSQTAQHESFGSYYKNELSEDEKKYDSNKDIEHSLEIISPTMKIDKIYRSMQGPNEYNDVSVSSDDELVWLVGYKGKVTSASGVVSEGYMCHNNIDVLLKEDNPWKIRTLGTNTRIFTLTQGQTDLHLPEGFGIPFPSDAEFQVSSQVLNHNEPDIDIDVRHEVELIYKNQSELSKPLIPLYQQAVFVAKQTSGPVGAYGSAIDSVYKIIEDNGVHHCMANCEIEYEGDFNPYQDQYGRVYNGHWSIDPHEEIIRTDVTEMMNLEFDTKIHFISIHVHPFATSLELIDKTTGQSVYKGYVVNLKDKIGLSKIDYYSSEEGLPVYKDHEYELVSIYHCSDTSVTHTAMATMFLYLEDK